MSKKSGILKIIVAVLSLIAGFSLFYFFEKDKKIDTNPETSIIKKIDTNNLKDNYQNVKNTKNYELKAKDNSISFVLNSYGARTKEIYINGSWNRLSNNIAIGDQSSQFYLFDFVFGTYTDLMTNNERPIYQIIQNSDNQILMTAKVNFKNGKAIVKRELIINDNNQVIEKLQISNISDKNILNLDFDGLAFTFGSFVDFARASSNNNNIPEYKYYDGEKLKKAKINGKSFFGEARPMAFISDVKWLTIADNFFLNIIEPNFTNTVVVYNGLDLGKNYRVGTGIQVLATNIQAGDVIEYDLTYYIGPRQEVLVTKMGDKEYKKLFAWPVVFNWMLKPIENATVWVMNSLVQFTGNAGTTLILIALLVKLLLLPLSIKSAISMKKMRILQPKLNKLQEKFGHDPQLLQQKTMELYQSEKANPLGGCLPLLLQIPVFFALFRVLSRSVELRGAGYLWINDLTMPDSLFMIGSFSFNLLPLLMTILQLVSVFLQQGRVGSAQNDMQKQMQTQSYFMPLIFLFLFWNMPAGLVLYWTVQNIFSIIEQEIINLDKHIKIK